MPVGKSVYTVVPLQLGQPVGEETRGHIREVAFGERDK